VKPIEKNKLNGVGNLRLLLSSICLRRTKGYVYLPEPQEIVYKIEFSPEEKELYSRVGTKLESCLTKRSTTQRSLRHMQWCFKPSYFFAESVIVALWTRNFCKPFPDHHGYSCKFSLEG